MDLDFLRTRYFEINNGRPIQFEGYFESMNWLEPFAYKERLNLIGFDVNQYNLIQLSLKEKDGLNYAFPVLMFHSLTGDLNELKQLSKGDRVIIYGRFYKLKKADFGVEVDVIESAKKSGHIFPGVVSSTSDVGTGSQTALFLDARVSPSPTPTFTPTPTPGISVWQKVTNLVNPKETATVTGTVTPDTN